MVMLLLGRQNVVISLVSDMFLERHVFRRCVLNEFRLRFQWKIVCSGEAQELKTVEILCESDISCFLCFFKCVEFREMLESHRISKSI